MLGTQPLYTWLDMFVADITKEMPRRQPPAAVAKSYINSSDPPWIEEKYIDNIKGR